MRSAPPPALAQAVVRVGEGRGFLVAATRRHESALVVTAAHCLPSWPEAQPDRWDTLHRDLLGPLGAPPTVWADCLFVDPVGDIAVLGPVDDQELGEQADAYEKLVGNAVPLPIADVARGEPIWLLSLEGAWFPGAVDHMGMGLIVSETKQPIQGGMSGSPIVQRGAAIGVLSASHGTHGESHHEGFEPRLVRHLPGWLLAAGHVRREWDAWVRRQKNSTGKGQAK
jgi:hypothetical protein